MPVLTPVAVCSLKDLKIFVPEAVIMGNAATLSCQFELEKATLYSVRWYFEAEEFYRFVPKESPPARTFPVSGITVDTLKVVQISVNERTDPMKRWRCVLRAVELLNKQETVK
uniref:Ig-like domain-containing protein n=1 Tax=Anopheles culicifacies TaxID=139723 RepID=A0A182MQ70_9DIPT